MKKFLKLLTLEDVKDWHFDYLNIADNLYFMGDKSVGENSHPITLDGINSNLYHAMLYLDNETKKPTAIMFLDVSFYSATNKNHLSYYLPESWLKEIKETHFARIVGRPHIAEVKLAPNKNENINEIKKNVVSHINELIKNYNKKIKNELLSSFYPFIFPFIFCLFLLWAFFWAVDNCQPYEATVLERFYGDDDIIILYELTDGNGNMQKRTDSGKNFDYPQIGEKIKVDWCF